MWSVARGLARNVREYREYKELLANCDDEASQDALGTFTEFFLRVCLDEVGFIQSLMQPERLRARILLWAEEEVRVGTLPGKAHLPWSGTCWLCLPCLLCLLVLLDLGIG